MAKKQTKVTPSRLPLAHHTSTTLCRYGQHIKPDRFTIQHLLFFGYCSGIATLHFFSLQPCLQRSWAVYLAMLSAQFCQRQTQMNWTLARREGIKQKKEATRFYRHARVERHFRA